MQGLANGPTSKPSQQAQILLARNANRLQWMLIDWFGELVVTAKSVAIPLE